MTRGTSLYYIGPWRSSITSTSASCGPTPIRPASSGSACSSAISRTPKRTVPPARQRSRRRCCARWTSSCRARRCSRGSDRRRSSATRSRSASASPKSPIAAIGFAFDIHERGTDRLICEASYRVACVDATTFAPRTFPDEIVALLRPARTSTRTPTPHGTADVSRRPPNRSASRRCSTRATQFVDRNVAEGRGANVAIECGDARVTYAEVLRNVNRVRQRAARRYWACGRKSASCCCCSTARSSSTLLRRDQDRRGAGAAEHAVEAGGLSSTWFATRGRACSIVSAELLPQIERIPGADAPSRCDTSSSPARDAPGPSRDFVGGVRLAGSSSSTPSRPAATRRRSGCIRRAAPARRRAACICSTTWSSARSCSAKGVLGIRPADRCFSVAKLFFAYGLGNALYFPFSVGATTILWPGPPTPQNVYEVIEKHRPTLFYSVPTGYGMLLAHQRPRRGAGFRPLVDPSRRLGGRGAAAGALRAIQAALRRRHHRRHRIDRSRCTCSSRTGRDAIRPGSSGLIVEGYEARIAGRRRTSRCRRARSATCGSSGDSVCAGYWNQHEKTKHTIEGHWIRTGDKYTQDADGYFWYAGRTDDMLKVGGLWVSPVEVENALIAHAAVLECGVVGREDHDGAGQADGVRRAARRRGRHRRSWRRSCSSSSASGWPSTSGRGGSSSSPSCRRRRPARSSASSCAPLRSDRQ